jgi:Zn-dependent protease with chaperone function
MTPIDINIQYLRSLDVESFRVPGEIMAFFISATPLVLLLLIFMLWWIALILLAISAILVVFQQKSLLGASVKITENQFPSLYRPALTASGKLFMAMPDVFVRQSPEMNAAAIGFYGNGSIIINTGLTDYLTDKEFQFVVGHEMGHIKAGHTKLGIIGGLHEVRFGLPVFSEILRWVFSFWRRKTEYTADRAGLIACEDPKAAITALLKLAVGGKLAEQINIPELMQQRQKLGSDNLAGLAETLQGHPYTLKRITQVIEFYHSPQYLHLKVNPQSKGAHADGFSSR